MRWRAALLLMPLALSACGGDDEDRIEVAAAASLKEPIEALARDFERRRDVDVSVRFAGSDELAAQIRQGVNTDVYLAADDELPRELAEEGELQEPVAFASNKLVIAAAKDGPVNNPVDLATDGVRLVIGDDGVPVGKYARAAIERLRYADREAVLANIRSEEPDVKGVLGKVAAGAADAGFIYVTDTKAVESDIVVVPLPAHAQPRIRYAGAVIEGAPDIAQDLMDEIAGERGRSFLTRFGFGAP